MNALIGYTGFVGGNLAAQADFDGRFNSKNIEAIRGQSFELGVCAAAPAEKWKANLDPDADRRTIEALMKDLSTAQFRHLVLISTIDVYSDPRGVDERHLIDSGDASAYGRHRRELERFVEEGFDSTIIRLPALFGTGLKKNAVYDLLHDNMVERIDSRAVFQFYDLENLWSDVERARASDIRALNVATEPVSMSDVAEAAFGIEFENHVVDFPTTYDFRSRYDHLWGRSDGYLYGRDHVLSALSDFVRGERDRLEGAS